MSDTTTPQAPKLHNRQWGKHWVLSAKLASFGSVQCCAYIYRSSSNFQWKLSNAFGRIIAGDLSLVRKLSLLHTFFYNIRPGVVFWLAQYSTTPSRANVNTYTYCNILIRPHFPVHTRGIHKWYTRKMCSLSFRMQCVNKGTYRNGESVYNYTCGVVEFVQVRIFHRSSNVITYYWSVVPQIFSQTVFRNPQKPWKQRDIILIGFTGPMRSLTLSQNWQW